MPKITKRIVDEAKPGSCDLLIRDSEMKGFGLKVTPKGSKSYFVEYRLPGGRGAPKGRIVLGKHGSPWTSASARREAQAILEGVRRGVDPVAAKKEAHRLSIDLAFDSYVDTFIREYAQREALRSVDQLKSAFRLHVIPAWGAKPLPEISRKDVSTLLARLAETSPSMARYVHAVLHKLFRWAVGRGDLEISRMTDMSPPASAVSRDRVLSDDELVALWRASHETFCGGAIRLLILTGQRRSEVLGMSFEELDMSSATWTIPRERSKNGKAHMVPLSAQAVAQLTALEAAECRRGLVFTTTGTTPISGVSKLKAALDKAMLQELRKEDNDASLVPWRLHDIRRTVATGLQRLGVRFEVTEAVLNHVSGAKSGVAGVYQRHDWAAEKRDALEAWGHYVLELTRGPDGSPQRRPLEGLTGWRAISSSR